MSHASSKNIELGVLGNTFLPTSKSPSIALVRAQSSEIKAAAILSSASWLGPFTLDAFLRREVALASQPLAQEDRLVTWILVDTRDSRSPRNILASCETWRKRCIVARRGNGEADDVIAYGVASVFCRREYRRRGYATRLMQELSQTLKDRGHRDGEQAVVSSLFSDVGKEFYAQSGWRPFPSKHIRLAPKASGGGDLPQTVPIETQDLQELCAADEAMLRQQVTRFRPGPARIRVAFMPDVQTMSWRHAREEFTAREFSHPQFPTVKGARVRLIDGSRVWCVWTKNFSNKEPDGGLLEVVRLVVEGQDPESEPDSSPSSHKTMQAIAACLQAAQIEAFRFDMDSIEIWNPSRWALAAARQLNPEIELIDRDSRNIICLNWFGPENPREIEWVASEAFEWC